MKLARIRSLLHERAHGAGSNGPGRQLGIEPRDDYVVVMTGLEDLGWHHGERVGGRRAIPNRWPKRLALRQGADCPHLIRGFIHRQLHDSTGGLPCKTRSGAWSDRDRD